MIGINITKFSPNTTHYYCRFYDIYDITVLDNLRNGDFSLYDYVENGMAKDEEKILHDFKADNEKDLMKKAAELIDDFYDAKKETVWFVCYEGKYSDSRTEYINNLNEEK